MKKSIKHRVAVTCLDDDGGVIYKTMSKEVQKRIQSAIDRGATLDDIRVIPLGDYTRCMVIRAVPQEPKGG